MGARQGVLSLHLCAGTIGLDSGLTAVVRHRSAGPLSGMGYPLHFKT